LTQPGIPPGLTGGGGPPGPHEPGAVCPGWTGAAGGGAIAWGGGAP
jgi:hypothetical protein